MGEGLELKEGIVQERTMETAWERLGPKGVESYSSVLPCQRLTLGSRDLELARHAER